MSLDFKNLLGAAGGEGIAGQATSSAMGLDNTCPSLSLKTRMIGFGACFGLGMLLSFMSTMSILNPTTFAVTYTLGNMIALASTGFLFGPVRQIKNMFALKRVVATVIYLTTLGLTLVVALKFQSVPGTIVCIIIQFLALIWYTLSYIPYARDCLWSAVTKCFTRG